MTKPQIYLLKHNRQQPKFIPSPSKTLNIQVANFNAEPLNGFSHGVQREYLTSNSDEDLEVNLMNT